MILAPWCFLFRLHSSKSPLLPILVSRAETQQVILLFSLFSIFSFTIFSGFHVVVVVVVVVADVQRHQLRAVGRTTGAEHPLATANRRQRDRLRDSCYECLYHLSGCRFIGAFCAAGGISCTSRIVCETHE